MLDEEAKAMQEVAKTAKEAIEAGRDAGGFFRLVLGDALIEYGGAAKDLAAYHRFVIRLRLTDKVNEILERRNIQGTPLPIPPRYAIPLIEASTMEDDEKIQSMWAGLIANAVDPNTQLDMKRVYIDVLRSLEPLDAYVMDYISRQGWKQVPQIDGTGITIQMIADSVEASIEDAKISLTNLHRLNCVEVLYPDMMPNAAAFLNLNDADASFRLSQFGISLLKGCKDHDHSGKSELEQLLAYVKSDRRVCPKPHRWEQLYRLLPETNRKAPGWIHQTHLILAGWNQTSDNQKREHLEAHIRYAAEKRVLEKIGSYLYRLPEDQWVHEGDI